MILTQRTPEARQAYFQGYRAGLALAINKLEEYGRVSAGGDGESINPSTGQAYGQVYFDLARTLSELVPQEIVESFEMK
jgi:hypothetical protein